MEPKSSQAPPSSSQAKKQQTLSAFFTPTSSQGTSQSGLSKPDRTNTKKDDKPVKPIATKRRNRADENEKPDPKVAKPHRRRRAPTLDLDGTDGEDDSVVLPTTKRARLRKRVADSDESDGTDEPLLSCALPDEPPAAKSKSSKDDSVSRTAQYALNNSVETEEVSEQDRIGKELLHKKFVTKLGHPDSLLELRRKRRDRNGSEQSPDDENGSQEEDEDEDEPAPKSSKRGKAQAGKKAAKLTPLEKQVLDVKKEYPDTILVVEVGYKYRFFGEDARVASRVLGIVCVPGKMRFDEDPSEAHMDKFASASIPTHRLHVHVKRLVVAGHKVGIVRQLETAALKAAGTNKGGPFVRKLTNLYTKATYVDDLEGLEATDSENTVRSSSSGHILCLTETGSKNSGSDEKVHIGLVAVQPATGDIVYDSFDDNFMRVELETRLLHIAPAEFVIVGDLSPTTERLLTHLTGNKLNVFGEQARIERIPQSKTMAAEAFSHVTNLYASKFAEGTKTEEEARTMELINNLPEGTAICLSALIKHLTDYGLENVFDLTKYFQPFSSRNHMLLNANTLSSLEIYQNQVDFSSKGSLFWCLDRTKTRFGQRLLRRWVGRPLLAADQLKERINAVDELRAATGGPLVEKLKSTLTQIRWDLEKTLLRLYYKKSTRPELYGMLQTLHFISQQYKHCSVAAATGFKSPLLSGAAVSLCLAGQEMNQFLDQINGFEATRDNKFKFFRDAYETEDMSLHKCGIQEFEEQLEHHRPDAAKQIGMTSVPYVTVAGIEYLIEIDNKFVKKVPASWVKISGTKKVSRFHTPQVVDFIRKRDQHRESLSAACDAAFVDLMDEIGKRYQKIRDCVQNVATLDCLLSLSEIASLEGYSKPVFIPEQEIRIRAGRHPMVERLLLDAYVPNDINLRSGVGLLNKQQTPTLAVGGGEMASGLLVTGPNMGGKSSFVRQVALICIMAQIGSFVPASTAHLPVLDAVYTRMGASDNMLRGESTFMVELSETSEILRQATPRSLIILDELGRGTSTHDGYSIAESVCRHVVETVGAMMLFVTHYQRLGRLEAELKPALRNVHMRFEEQIDPGEEQPRLTFLYQVGPGMAHRSYGLNVARLASLPGDVITNAGQMSKRMEEVMEARKLDFVASLFSKLDMSGSEEDADKLVLALDEL